MFGRRAVPDKPLSGCGTASYSQVGMVFQQICAPSPLLQDSLSLKTSKEHKHAFPKELMKSFTRIEKSQRKIFNPTHNVLLSWALLARLTVTLCPLACLPSVNAYLLLQTTLTLQCHLQFSQQTLPGLIISQGV